MALDFSMLAPVYLYGQTNLISVETHKVEIQIKLNKEIKMGRVLGLFLRNNFNWSTAFVPQPVLEVLFF
jgi:hypothetical protein